MGQLGIGFENAQNSNETFHLVFKETNISLINHGTKKLVWSSQIHPFLDYHFKDIVFSFCASLKVVSKKINLKFPKYILFEILKLALKDFLVLNFQKDSLKKTNKNKNEGCEIN